MKSMRLCATLILSAVAVTRVGLAAQGNPPPPLVQPVAPAPAVSGPLIQFDNPSFDFGKASLGEKVRHNYIVTNTGTEPLQITNVHPSCHCTAAGDWSHSPPIEPGKTVQIPVQLDTSGMNGPVTRTIDVYSNAKNEPRKTLLLKGTVWKPIDVTPSVALLNIPPDATNEVTTTVRIVNQTDNPVTISNPVSANDKVFTALLKETKPGKEYDLLVTSHPPYNPGNAPGTITLTTSLASSPTISVPVTASVPQPIQIYPAQIFVNAAPDRWTTNKVTIHANTSNVLVLSNPKASDSRIHVEIQPMTPAKGMFNLMVAFPPGFQAEPGKPTEVTVESNHPRFPTIQIPIRDYARGRPVTAFASRQKPNPPAVQSSTLTSNASSTHQNPPPPPTAAHP
jgi:hypothetical protein